MRPLSNAPTILGRVHFHKLFVQKKADAKVEKMEIVENENNRKIEHLTSEIERVKSVLNSVLDKIAPVQKDQETIKHSTCVSCGEDLCKKFQQSPQDGRFGPFQ